jgi:hypothetical protein
MKKYDEEKMIEWLKTNGPATPTEIGMAVYGLPYGTASSTVSNVINRCICRLKRGPKRGQWMVR